MPDILVIEDDALVRQSLIDTLTAYGFTVHGARDGIEGLELARTVLPEIIVSDVHMPRMDGYSLLQELRNDPATDTIPFIFLTVNGAREQLRQGMEEGADDYISKPFEPDELLQAVKTQLKKRLVLTEKHHITLRLTCKNIAYVLPHELRTPLSSVLGYAELLRMDYAVLSPEAVLKHAEAIYNGGKRLQRVIENYLVYAQLEILAADEEERKAYRNRITPACGDIIVDEAQKTALEYQRLSDLSLHVDNVALIIAEADLRKIIHELVDNAFKFSSPCNPVCIISSTEGDRSTILVQDMGRGMTVEQIRSVGEYMQFERAVHEQQGLGLGLVIAKRLVELHDGNLDIKSSPGSGTDVRISFRYQ